MDDGAPILCQTCRADIDKFREGEFFILVILISWISDDLVLCQEDRIGDDHVVFGMEAERAVAESPCVLL